MIFAITHVAVSAFFVIAILLVAIVEFRRIRKVLGEVPFEFKSILLTGIALGATVIGLMYGLRFLAIYIFG